MQLSHFHRSFTGAAILLQNNPKEVTLYSVEALKGSTKVRSWFGLQNILPETALGFCIQIFWDVNDEPNGGGIWMELH
jgi:hypothetical protein